MTDIFISYSHKDEAWKDELQAHLRVLQQHGEFSVWDDRQIRLGDNWLPEIEKAINSAKVAILMVSRDFLTSDFIAQEEITKFLQLRQQCGLRVIPLIVRPCPWKAVPWLADLQGATKDNEPLSRFELGSHELEAELSRIVIKVFGFLQEAREEEQRRIDEARKHEVEVAAGVLSHMRQKGGHRRKVEKEEERVVSPAEETERLQRETEQLKQSPLVMPAQTVMHAGSSGFGGNRKWLFGGLIVLIAVVVFFLSFRQQASTAVSFAQVVGETRPPPLPKESAVVVKAEVSPESRLAFEPEMVRIEGGEFEMGCVSGKGCQSDEKPVHKVAVLAFEMGKYEVTVAQFWAFVKATGYKTTAEKQGSCRYFGEKGSWGDVKGMSWREAGFSREDDHPAICISWDDAQEYVTWLSKKTGKKYRLPAEAEWEFAVRAGTETQFYTGDCINTAEANFNGKSGWVVGGCPETGKYRGTTVAVDRFSGNDFGLFNMHGNVYEWVEDCYRKNYESDAQCEASKDGVVLRTARGGSWTSKLNSLRSWNRSRRYGVRLDADIGFRVARTL